MKNIYGSLLGTYNIWFLIRYHFFSCGSWYLNSQTYMVGTSVLNRFLASMDPIPARPAPWALPMNTETYPRPARLGGDGGCLYPWWLEYINTYTYIYIYNYIKPQADRTLTSFFVIKTNYFSIFLSCELSNLQFCPGFFFQRILQTRQIGRSELWRPSSAELPESVIRGGLNII